jgi:hypothetical protein
LVEVDQRGDGARLDDRPLGVGAGERSNRHHRLPAGKDEKLHPIAHFAAAELSAAKAGDALQFGEDALAEVLRISVRSP